MTTTHNNFVLRLRHASLNYPLRFNRSIKIFEGLNLEVQGQEKIGIWGPSGSGKTSLFNLINGFLPHSKNEVQVNGKISRIYQKSKLIPFLTCLEHLELELIKFKKSLPDDQTIDEWLRLVELLKQKNSLVYHLSGGEKQRLALLIAILSGASIILADEPFSRLPIKTGEEFFLQFLQIIEERKMTLLLASHHFNYFKNFDRVYEIKNYNLIPVST